MTSPAWCGGYAGVTAQVFALNQSAALRRDPPDPDLEPPPPDENPWQHCIKVYRVTGKLGMVTDNMFSDGRTLYDRVKYEFIRPDHVDKVLASFQATYQRRMFQQAGVRLNSQEAYDVACQGPIRPALLKEPVVYGLKCVHFKPPDFTIEVHCIGEYEEFLIRLIYDLGTKLRSAAICTSIQCIRFAQFGLEHSLLRKHWRVQHVIENIAHNETLVDKMDPMRPQLQSVNMTDSDSTDGSNVSDGNRTVLET
ncbi:hypothetical protein M8J77_001440 [Diaphorina citri]|nr:hypothetical protein M8J77_001440 [Diaphorina citri]